MHSEAATIRALSLMSFQLIYVLFEVEILENASQGTKVSIIFIAIRKVKEADEGKLFVTLENVQK